MDKPKGMARLGDKQPEDGQLCFVRFRVDGWTWKATWNARKGVWVYPGGYEGQSYDADLWWPDLDS